MKYTTAEQFPWITIFYTLYFIDKVCETIFASVKNLQVMSFLYVSLQGSAAYAYGYYYLL